MQDLYAEVMAVLHDTGAFARWQQDRRTAQATESARITTEQELRPGMAGPDDMWCRTTLPRH